jgi:limonene-1,2-epoxide hydrolase
MTMQDWATRLNRFLAAMFESDFDRMVKRMEQSRKTWPQVGDDKKIKGEP